MKQEDEKFMGTLILASQHPLKSQSMINYLEYFCVNSVHYPSLVKNN